MENKLAIIPFIFAAILLAGGCGKQNTIIKAHNQLGPIESTMVDSYNSSTTADEQATAVKTALDALNRVDISKCPADYQQAWGELADLWTEWHAALLAEDIPTVDSLAKQSPVRAKTLNSIARSHGVQVIDP
ncbi:MAG: hypothetical protein OSB41_15685 [Kiritimatiellae bacterium]|nr:hypothetical protein [Kiritimatiellia bacterium]